MELKLQFAYKLIFNQFKTSLLITLEYPRQKNAFLKNNFSFWYFTSYFFVSDYFCNFGGGQKPIPPPHLQP